MFIVSPVPFVSRVEIFVERLQSLAAKSGITFKMANYAQDLTTDIITQLTIAQDSNVQSTPDSHGEKFPTGLLTANRRSQRHGLRCRPGQLVST